MAIVIITGSSGLVGSEAVNFFSKKKYKVIGIDNNLRKFFFGNDGSTSWIKKKIIKQIEEILVILNININETYIFDDLLSIIISEINKK